MSILLLFVLFIIQFVCPSCSTYCNTTPICPSPIRPSHLMDNHYLNVTVRLIMRLQLCDVNATHVDYFFAKAVFQDENRKTIEEPALNIYTTYMRCPAICHVMITSEEKEYLANVDVIVKCDQNFNVECKIKAWACDEWPQGKHEPKLLTWVKEMIMKTPSEGRQKSFQFLIIYLCIAVMFALVCIFAIKYI